MSAHILRKVNGWTIQETAERIRGERDIPQMLSFFEDGPVLRERPVMTQSQPLC